ncbi:hypothetical protein INR49_005949 [Caranx melampygus]|nr:hypothetical protein INR49_005949 [Caranx melampygus]
METLASTASLVTLDTRGLVLSNWLELKQVTHHHLGLVLLLVGAGQSGQDLDRPQSSSTSLSPEDQVCVDQVSGRTRSVWTHLTADDPGEVGLLWGVDVELGLVGSLPLVLSADLQGQSVVISDVDLITVAVATKTNAMVTSYIKYLSFSDKTCGRV